MFETVGLIGTGNMGSAVLIAAKKSGLATTYYLSNRTEEKAKDFAKKLGAGTVTTNEGVAEKSELIFLGVKPQMMPGVLAGIRDILKARADKKDPFVLCTMAAGLSCQRIQEMAGGNYPVLRIMPNTPAAIGHGMIQYCSKDATPEMEETLSKMLAPAGKVVAIEERLLDAAASVSGCGPAFAYMFAEALADGGVACGLPRKDALTYAAVMLEGAAEMLLESGAHPGALKDAVCSPGGTTIQGVRTLEAGGFRAAVMNAVIAAYEKTMDLR